MILLVEDHDDLRVMLRALLERSGFAVESVADGDSAMAAMHLTTPQLVVLDLMIPNKTGWEVRREMLRHTRLRRVPVIIATGILTTELRLSELKVAAVMSKPLSGNDLISTIRKHMLPEPAHA